MPSLQAAFFDFMQALNAIGNALLSSVMAVFQAIFGLGQQLLGAVFSLFRAVAQLFIDVSQNAIGFVFANFFVLLIIGGGYYWYTNRSASGRGTRKGTKRV